MQENSRYCEEPNPLLQELRDELTKRGLDSTGLKAALADRLEESIKTEENGQADGGAKAPTADAAQASETAAPAPAATNGELVSPVLHSEFARKIGNTSYA